MCSERKNYSAWKSRVRFVIVILLFAKATSQPILAMESAMESHKILPDVIDKAPSYVIEVSTVYKLM